MGSDMHATADGGERRTPGSLATLRRAGVALGLLLTCGMAALLLYDREIRVDAAYRQSLAVAAGADRVLYYGLRNVQRALNGVVADMAAWSAAADEAEQARLLAQSIDGMLARQPELHSVEVVDGHGRPLSGGRGDPGLPAWLETAGPDARANLVVGVLQVDAEGAGWLPLATPFGPDRWLLARLRTEALDAMIRDLDVGRDGIVTVLDRRGVVLARLPRDGRGGVIGRRTSLPDATEGTRGTSHGLRASQIDGVLRLSGSSSGSGYDLVVVAGLGLHETLVPWYRNATIAAALVLLYWLGLGYLLRRVSGGERMRETLLDALEEQARWLDSAQQASRTGVWRLESDGDSVRVSAHTAAMFGFPAEPTVLPAASYFEQLHPDDRERVTRLFDLTRTTGAPYSVEYRVRPRPGVERWIRARGGLVTDSRGQARLTGTVVDITEHHEAMARIAQAEAQFRALFRRNPLPFLVLDAGTLRVIAANDAALSVYGYGEEEFREKTILDLRAPAGDGAAADGIDGVWVHLRRDGSRLDVRVFSSGIEFGGRPARLVLAEDISDRVAYERDLAWRASHDSLTGLLRLSALVEQLDARHVEGGRYAVAFVHLLGLELVAPTLGARTSELLLREMAARLELVGSRFGMCGFWPGDAFVVVALDAERRDAMLSALEEAISMPVETEGGAHPVEAAIGTALGPGPGEGAEQVVGHAALAALQARQEQVSVLPYDRSMADQASERIALTRRLRNAIDHGEFELHYQPIRRVSDGRLVSLEALLRWRLDGGLVSPAVFMPLAEASGLVVPIGRWVLEQAARAHARLAARGLADVAVAVNVSAVQLLGDSVADAVRALQQQYALPAGALHVELTESVLVRHPQAASARMRALRDAGVPVLIDDFGTGFSSLSYLRNLPLDALKIDRSFVQDVHEDERNASICRALIALAGGLGLATVAEGVESEAELAWLEANGCSQAQGYLFGRPAPLDAVLDAITDSTRP